MHLQKSTFSVLFGSLHAEEIAACELASGSDTLIDKITKEANRAIAQRHAAMQ